MHYFATANAIRVFISINEVSTLPCSYIDTFARTPRRCFNGPDLNHKRSTRLLCLYQGIALSRSTDLIHFPSIPCWVRQRSLDSHADNTHKDKKYIYIFFPCDIFRPQFRPSFVRLMFSSNTMQNDIISLISTELCIRYSYVIASIGNVLVQVCVCVARWWTG